MKVNPAHVVKWNTNRTYTKYGQRMAAVRTEFGVVFADKDRMICGLIPDGAPLSPKWGTRDIMFFYDRDMFEQSVPSVLRVQLEAVWE